MIYNAKQLNLGGNSNWDQSEVSIGTYTGTSRDRPQNADMRPGDLGLKQARRDILGYLL